VLPQFRNLGLGTEPLRMADESARKLGKRGMSIIVSDANIGARRLYERLGYREIARRTMVREQWVSDGHEWVLLIKLFDFVMCLPTDLLPIPQSTARSNRHR
jgi:GNAT superfamily N-acetyltransferase